MRSRLQPARGFVLPVTVIVLALVAVGIALMAHHSDQLRRLVEAAQREQQAAAEVQAALAQAQVLAASMYRQAGRRGTIELDGRFYRTPRGTYISWQDAAGLLNLGRATEVELAALLRAVGVGEERVARLVDTLLDYADADGLTRLNGAEAQQYEAAGLPPPRNAALLVPDEVQRIAAWSALDAALRRRVLDLVAVGPAGGINRYTVKAPVLAAVAGIDVAAAQALLDQRAPGQPVPLESLQATAGGASLFGMGRYVAMPGPTVVLTICPTQVVWCQRVSLTTTDADPAPWHVDYSVRQARTTPLPAAQSVAPLPDQPPPAPPPVMLPFGLMQ